MHIFKKIFEMIPNASFIKIKEVMYRINGHIIEETEKELFVLHEDSGNEYIYNLNKPNDMKTLMNATFYKCKEMV